MMNDGDSLPTDKSTIATGVERIERFRGSDLHDLCDATILAIQAGGGFGWVTPPSPEILERYYQGVLSVPGRTLFAARLDGMIAGSAQLLQPPPNNEAQAFAATLASSFIAPWARGHGLAKQTVDAVEAAARKDGFSVLQLDVRETQTAAISLYETLGYRCWGRNPVYARVGRSVVAGLHFYKILTPDDPVYQELGAT